jgi:hypothetical protein
MLNADLKMNAQELKDRTKQFALRVMHLVDALPETPKGRAVASQLVRSGMGVAANYRAACRGRSHAEFISNDRRRRGRSRRNSSLVGIDRRRQTFAGRENCSSAEGGKRTNRDHGGLVHIRVAQ